MSDNKIKLSIFKRALNRDLNIIKISYVILITLISFSLFYLVEDKYASIAGDLSTIYASRDAIIQGAVYDLNPEIKETQIIKEIFQITEELKKSLLYIANLYSSYNFAFSIFFTFFSIISGTLGFLLVKKGWDNNSSFYLKSSFLIAFFCTSLFGLLPNVFAAKDNINSNLSKYYLFSNLQIDIYNLARDTKGYLKRNTAQSLDSLNKEIVIISNIIKQNQEHHFDINTSKIPTQIKPSLEP